MTNNNVFEMEKKFEMDAARAVLTAKLDPSWIKSREVSGTKLSYIEGNIVIDLLNTAFNYQWSFEIVEKEIVPSLPKAMVKWENRKRVPDLDENGKQKYQPQPPVAQVLGRLTVPGLGIREQYGSKVIIGGATEQEHTFKSAATDALKKCASLFGIGAELYRDDWTANVQDLFPAEQSTQATPAQGTQKVEPVKQQEPVASTPNEGSTTATGVTPAVDWDPADIKKTKELKITLGINNNEQLTPYIQDFFENKEMGPGHLTPANIKAFNIYLARKIEQGA